MNLELSCVFWKLEQNFDTERKYTIKKIRFNLL